jgi:murein DD-endopeptidase MepM/ murein hydrolase activator NlpD
MGWVGICLLAACSAVTPTVIATVAATETLAPSQAPSGTPLPPSATATPRPTATLTATPLPPSPTPGPQLCSPLEDVTLKELPEILSGNTYQPPLPGRDDGHPGADFAYWTRGSHKTMLGLPLKAAMAGRVAAVIPDRKPYGNAIIIEVALDSVPQRWLPNLNWPVTPAPTVVPDARLTCPYPLKLPGWDTSRRSLYLAYGHLNELSPLHVGDRVTCGQVIGAVGTTGASVNPHLHFEARLGPAGMTLNSFGHYDAHTTEEERNNYCLWRVSNWFQLVDPLKILSQEP